MGQNISTPKISGADLRKADAMWLQKDLAEAFDITFLTKQVPNLPPLVLESILSDQNKISVESDHHVQSERKHLAEIFGLGKTAASLSVREMPELDIKAIRSSSLSYLRDRAVVLQRFYHAHRRQITFALQERKEAEDVAQKVEEQRLAELKGTTNKDKEQKGSNGLEEGAEDDTVFPLSQPEGFFVASSIEMSLVLARSMAMSGSPIVVNSVCHTLLNLMEKSQGGKGLVVGSSVCGGAGTGPVGLPMVCCQWCAASGVLPVVCCQWCAASGVLPVVCCQWCAASGVLPVGLPMPTVVLSFVLVVLTLFCPSSLVHVSSHL
jgi:hypothetical protein